MPTNSLERALVLLKVVERTPGGLRHAEIARQLEIPKSTCTYILSRLEREGYLLRDEATGKFRIGLATVALAYGALRETGIHSVAEPALYKLTQETGLSAGIGVLERGWVLLVDRVEGPGFVNRALEARPYRARSQRDVGRELPVHSTALGKVLLAYLPKEQVRAVIAQRGLRRYTRKTNVSEARLLGELEAVRKQSFAVADEEAYLDLRALAAPVFDAAGAVRAAVSVNGSPKDPVWSDLDSLVALVQNAARDISRRARLWSANLDATNFDATQS
ncbi:MAG TPA: IclR family transcriptional regulator [Bryobacteraceae bacterium]